MERQRRSGPLASGAAPRSGHQILQKKEGALWECHPATDTASILKNAAREIEGMVSKLADRPYRAGRSKDWIKVKSRNYPALSCVMDAFA